MASRAFESAACKPSGSSFWLTVAAVISLLLLLLAIAEVHPLGEAARLSSRLKAFNFSTACPPCACEQQAAPGAGQVTSVVAAAPSAGCPDLRPSCPDCPACPEAPVCPEAPACPECTQCTQCPPQPTCPEAPPCPPAAVGGVGKGPPLPEALGALHRAPWEPSLPERELQKGVVSYGDLARMRRFVHKLLAGQAVTVGEQAPQVLHSASRAAAVVGAAPLAAPSAAPASACEFACAALRRPPTTAAIRSACPPAVAIGGSVSYGVGASIRGQSDYVALLFKWINTTFPHPQHQLLNRALPCALLSVRSARCGVRTCGKSSPLPNRCHYMRARPLSWRSHAIHFLHAVSAVGHATRPRPCAGA